MLDNRQLKTQGLRFGRTLQMVFRTTVMFSVDHVAVQAPLQQSFAVLNSILKETGQFTFGFVEKEIMLNKLLTTDPGLNQLEIDLLKRGFSAVTFEAGITLSRYKNVISLLASSVQVIEQSGGAREFVLQNPIDGVRIFPAMKDQKRTQSGDRILESDSEAYLASKQLSEFENSDFTDTLDLLLESAGFDKTARLAVVTGLKASRRSNEQDVVDDQYENAAYLEPVEPAGDAIHSAGSGGSGSAPPEVHSAGMAGAIAAGLALEAKQSGFVTHGTRVSGAIEVLTGGSQPTGFLGEAAPPPPVGFHSVADVIRNSVERSLTSESGDPQRSYLALARLLRDVQPEMLLSHFPAERRQALRMLPPDQLAAEIVEDTALAWVGKRLNSDVVGNDRVIIEEEVLHVLARTLRATQMTDRFARKVAKLVSQHALPEHFLRRVQDELLWAKMPFPQRHAFLLRVTRFSEVEFRRLIEHTKELLKQEKIDQATELAVHYFSMLDVGAGEIAARELTRSLELIRIMSVARAGFVPSTSDLLGKSLLRAEVPYLVHCQIADCLRALAQTIAAYEDFEHVRNIGSWIEQSLQSQRERHEACCGAALESLLPAAAVERLIEIYMERRDDSEWVKLAGTLLRRSGASGLSKVFERLDDEKSGPNRLALMRLIKLSGPAAIQVAQKRLTDDRWYVVRNACTVLRESKDAGLLTQLAPLLRHSDHRVQQTVLDIILKSQDPSRCTILAEALPHLSLNVLERALQELAFLKDPTTVTRLEAFLFQNGYDNPRVMCLAVEALGAMQSEKAIQLLGNILSDRELQIPVRRAAMNSMSRSRFPVARTLLSEFVAHAGDDTLAPECRKVIISRAS